MGRWHGRRAVAPDREVIPARAPRTIRCHEYEAGMADDGDGDEPKNEPTQLPLRPRPPRPVGVPAPLPRDTRGQLGAQRVAFTRTYLGMLQEPEIVNHIRELLTKGSAREIAALLTPLA